MRDQTGRTHKRRQNLPGPGSRLSFLARGGSKHHARAARFGAVAALALTVCQPVARAGAPHHPAPVSPGASAPLLLTVQATQAGSASVAPQDSPAQQPSLTAPSATAPQGGTLHGTVVAGTAGKPGGVPLPGVAITATNTLTGRKYTTATDVDGAYTMKIPRNGRYVVRAELAGFAPVTTEVVLNGSLTQPTPAPTPADFDLQLASRVAEAEARDEASASAASSAATGSAGTASLLGGLQNLNLSAGAPEAEDASAGGGNGGASLPQLGAVADTPGAGGDTFSVSGQSGQMNGLANFSEDELRRRIADGVAAARASGQLPPGIDPTNAIVGILGPIMGLAGPGGGGDRRGGGAGGFGGSGAFRRMDPTQLHGGLNWQGEYAALDSAPWSPTLTPQTKPGYARDTFGVTLAGSPQIPGLIRPSKKQFGFMNFNLSRNTTPEVLTGVVPTVAERGGDFSALTQTQNGQPVATTLFDPLTQQPFRYNGVTNAIDPLRISSQAQYILNHFYPLPNVPVVGTQTYNYQTVTTVGQNSANLSTRFIRNLGSAASQPFFGRFGGGARNAPATLHQSLNVNFSYSHSASDIRNIILPLSGTTASDGYNGGAGYVLGKGRFNNNVSVTWNRSDALTRNYFTNTGNDPAVAAGIALPSTAALGNAPDFYNGLPSLQINNFLFVTNTDPQQAIGQTISFTDQVSWRHRKHNMRFGVDVRRVERNYLGGGNPLGTFTFTGFNTEDPCTNGVLPSTSSACQGRTNPNSTTGEPDTGSAFADFLLGLPQQTEIQAGLSKIYLRENVEDWYANDDFRVTSGLTLNFGLRYEYFGPFSEIHNRLVNLTGVTPGTTSVGCVTPTGISVQTAAGLLTCAPGPTNTLLHADKSMYSPRFGFAYRPKVLPGLTKDTVLRGGYGVNYNTGQFATFAQNLSYQAPFALTQNNFISLQNTPGVTATNGCVPETPTGSANLTLAQGFGCSAQTLYQNTYAVDPNYRLGLVQIYNLDVQRTLPLQIVLSLDYNGSHGSDLNVVNAPNHIQNTPTTPNATAFLYQQSIAESTFNALTVNVQKRLQKGIQLAAKYQWAHSIDDASSINGTSETSSVQNPEDLHAERSNSSFDIRHQLTGSWIYELPVGPNRAFLNRGGLAAKLLDGLSLSGTYTLQSGGYFTPVYQSTAAEVSAGGSYTLRPDRNFAQPISGLGQVRSFFNPAAFTAPQNGYGSASRFSIQGPGEVLISSSLSRTVPLGETRSFEARVTANNVFNTVQYSGIDTSLTSATFGQVTGAQTMRQLLFVARFRF